MLNGLPPQGLRAFQHFQVEQAPVGADLGEDERERVRSVGDDVYGQVEESAEPGTRTEAVLRPSCRVTRSSRSCSEIGARMGFMRALLLFESRIVYSVLG